MTRFLDTNVLMRHFTNDDPVRAPQALALIERIERGEERVVTSMMIVFETVFLLERRYKVPKATVRELVWDVLSMRGVQLTGKALCSQAFDLYVEKNVSFADAYSAVYMQSRDLTEIYSWDADFDKIPGLSRIEPDQ